MLVTFSDWLWACLQEGVSLQPVKSSHNVQCENHVYFAKLILVLPCSGDTGVGLEKSRVNSCLCWKERINATKASKQSNNASNRMGGQPCKKPSRVKYTNHPLEFEYINAISNLSKMFAIITVESRREVHGIFVRTTIRGYIQDEVFPNSSRRIIW